MKSNLQSIAQDRHVTNIIHPECVSHYMSPDQTTDEPHAVLALGNFFGDGNSFVKIPWQLLQLTDSSRSVSVDIFPAASISHKFGRSNVASLEIKRDANDCIQITARKNPH